MAELIHEKDLVYHLQVSVEDAYGTDPPVAIPPGYEFVAFRPPKKKELFIGKGVYNNTVEVAIYDWDEFSLYTPRVIVKRIPRDIKFKYLRTDSKVEKGEYFGKPGLKGIDYYYTSSPLNIGTPCPIYRKETI